MSVAELFEMCERVIEYSRVVNAEKIDSPSNEQYNQEIELIHDQLENIVSNQFKAISNAERVLLCR